MAQYRFEAAKEDYSHFSSGHVFASAPGLTGFPVRLASEVFQGCLALMPPEKRSGRHVLYDPCCGAGYLLATIGYRHWESLRRLIGSDPDCGALAIAERNLRMLTREGLLSKLEFLKHAQAREPRSSQEAAIGSVRYFLDRLEVLEQSHRVETHLFRADAGSRQSVTEGMAGGTADIVIADVPYGGLAQWQGALASGSRHGAITILLESIRSVLSSWAVVAIVSPKGDTATHPAYQRRRKLKLGKRLVTFLCLQHGSSPTVATSYKLRQQRG